VCVSECETQGLNAQRCDECPWRAAVHQAVSPLATCPRAARWQGLIDCEPRPRIPRDTLHHITPVWPRASPRLLLIGRATSLSGQSLPLARHKSSSASFGGDESLMGPRGGCSGFGRGGIVSNHGAEVRSNQSRRLWRCGRPSRCAHCFPQLVVLKPSRDALSNHLG